MDTSNNTIHRRLGSYYRIADADKMLSVRGTSEILLTPARPKDIGHYRNTCTTHAPSICHVLRLFFTM